jgi:hypothetical protein
MTIVAPRTGAEVAAFGIAWDGEWLDQDRLLIRGYRAGGGVNIMAKWDVESLLATLDAALEAATWSEMARSVARSAIRELYAADITEAGFSDC